MPRTVRLDDSDPELEKAMAAVGVAPVRAAVLRELALFPHGRTSGQIARALGATSLTVFRHLVELEKAGVVDPEDAGEQPHGQRQGRRVVYRLNRAARDASIARLLDYLDGKPAT